MNFLFLIYTKKHLALIYNSFITTIHLKMCNHKLVPFEIIFYVTTHIYLKNHREKKKHISTSVSAEITLLSRTYENINIYVDPK